MEEASELADPQLCLEDISAIAAEVAEALRQLDEAELVSALCRMQVEGTSVGSATGSGMTQVAAQAWEELPARLKVLEQGLAECSAWLQEHAESFYLASASIQAIVAGWREDLERFPDLQVTTWKFEPLIETLRLATGEDAPKVPSFLAQALRATVAQGPGVAAAAELPTARLKDRETARLPTLLAYPREELKPMWLAAASGEGALPKVLRWRSPDQRHTAALVLAGNRATLNFYRGSGERAEELAGLEVRLAGARVVIGPQARIEFDLQQLYNRGEDVYLDVGQGQERQRWIPVGESETKPASVSS
ncbi:hypothetical protein HRbin36_02247 [bacterium HR36]|nr:hypothetical protein HRbin36_02247 [bacterium HR36]